MCVLEVRYCPKLWKWTLRMVRGSVGTDLVSPLPELGAVMDTPEDSLRQWRNVNK